ncbi:hypothetical protein P4C99_11745 [Pontiellaceae bacterium B1224]|nr:hypothetical protein [Pontiellaceae bacterium B1224]
MTITKTKPFLTIACIGVLLSAASASAVGLYEAEDAIFSSGSAKTHADASGGWYLDGNGGFNITWSVNAEAGDHVLAFGIKVPSGDRTMGVFVNNAKVGTVNTAARSWEVMSVQATLAAGLNTIELRDSEGTAELDVDFMFVSEAGGSLFEAEDMVLTGYAVETNSAASGGQLVRLDGNQGTAADTLYTIAGGMYDLTISYFDETDGEAAFKVYLNDRLIDSWLADRLLGSSEPAAVNRMERTVKNVSLRGGDTLEICGFANDGEEARIDGYSLQAAAEPAGISMDWNSDGSIAHLILNGTEHLDASEASGVIFRIFDGYGIDTLEQYAAEQTGSMVEIHEADLDYARFYFRMDEYDHHLVLRLIGMDGVPRDDASLNIRLEIPYTTLPGYQLLDASVSVDVSGGVLELDWNQLAQRDLLAGGQIALYAASDATAALAEIEQVHTDNGNLDDYYAWIGGFPIIGTDADLFADPDGDGINNLTEYAMGGLPALGSDPVRPMIINQADELELYYNRRRDADDRGLTYALLRTDNLVKPVWYTNGVAEAGSLVLDSEFESVTNRVGTTDSEAGFFQLDVDLER